MPEILLFFFGSNLTIARVVLGCCWISIQACLVLLYLIVLVKVARLCIGWRGSVYFWFGYCSC